jgi:hypothetical protein
LDRFKIDFFFMGEAVDNSSNSVRPENRLFFYLERKFNETKFPFFYVPLLEYEQVFNKDEANELAKAGIIRKRTGMNGNLIEFLGKQK